MILKNLNSYSSCEMSAEKVAQTNKVIRQMEVNALDEAIDGHTHIGVVRIDGHMVKYLGWMIDGLFQFNPTTRRVTQYL
ncbi:MAG: hypothetical protein RLP44_02385 [Aggregatilineales bacterium]